jgi:polar amino acid transport system permease protein
MILKILNKYWKSIFCSIVIVVLCFIPGDELSQPEFDIPFFDKIVHFSFYFTLSLIMQYEVKNEVRSRKYFFIFMYALFLGGFIEVIQGTFIFERSGSFLDLIADLTGTLFAFPVYKKLPDSLFDRKHLKKGLKIFIFLFLIGVMFFLGYKNLDYNWQWYRVKPYLFAFENGEFVRGLLLEGLIITLKISSIGLVFSLVIGFLSAFARLSSSPMLRFVSWFYVEIIRNTPLLIQIFLMYFVIAPVFDISAFFSAVIALSLFEGAYSSEIIRSGILSVPKGQYEAAQSIGLSAYGTYIKVIIPQMLRQTLPMLAGQSVSLIKDSALVSTISIFDLTMQGQRIVSQTFLTFEIWFTVALCYLVITASLSLLIRQFENRLKYIN